MIKRILFSLSAIFTCIVCLAQEKEVKEVKENNGKQVNVDRIISVVGDEAILQSDIDAFYLHLKINGGLPDTDNPKCFLLEELINQKIFVAQAKLDSVSVDLSGVYDEVERKIATQVAMLGGEEAFERIYGRSIHLIRQETFDFETEQTYSHSMQREIVAGIKVTPNEVAKFFKTIPKDSLPIVPDQYTLYEIVKKPNSEAAIYEVKDKLLDLRKRIIAGEKFQTLASLYSEDPVSARRGGEVGLSPLESYVAPVRDALKNMREGQVSNIIESEFGFHILQMIEKQDANKLVNYRHILLRPKYTDEDKQKGFAVLDSIAIAIKGDSITFENAAMLFSENEASRAGGGLVFNVEGYGLVFPYFDKDRIDPNDYKAIEHLSINEISPPFETVDRASGNVVYKLMKIKNFVKSHPINLESDYSQVQNIYKNRKQTEAITSWVEKKRKTEYIRVHNSQVGCPFVQPEWLYK